MSETSVIAYMSGNAPAEVDATHPLPVTNTPSGTQTVDTELPAAAALNGTIAKSVSAPVVGAALLASDGTNLVQPLGDAANGLDVDVTRLPPLPAGSNVIGHMIIDSAGNVSITSLPPLPAGSSVIGHVIVDSAGGVVVTTLPATPAGENHTGQVGGTTLLVRPTVTVSTSPAYTSADVVGGKLTLTSAVRVSGGTGILESVLLVDRANQKPNLDVFIFDSDPTNGTYTDNAQVSFSTDDVKLLGRFSISSSDWYAPNARAIACIRGIGMGVKAASGTSLFAVFVSNGSTPTFVATTDIQATFTFLCD